MALQPRFVLYYFVSFLVFHWIANTLFPPTSEGTFEVPNHDLGTATHHPTTCPPPQRINVEDPNPEGKVSSSSTQSCSNNLVSSRNSFLTIAHPIAPLNPESGKIQIPEGITRLCVDVGTYISSPTSKKWWSLKPDTFVIGVEANPFSFAMMKYMADPRMVGAPGNYWPQYRKGSAAAKDHPGPNCNVSEVSYCLRRTWKHITDNANKFLLINAAGYDTNSYLSFQMGVEGHPDTGSLYEFKQKKYAEATNLGKVNVAAVKLSDILSYVPTNEDLLWDTLKIDAQGADVSVLFGVGDIINRFLCVIGEFDMSAYKVQDKEHRNVGAHMASHGFAAVDGRFYVNKRFKEIFVKGDYLCRATDEVRTKEQILQAINK